VIGNLFEAFGGTTGQFSQRAVSVKIPDPASAQVIEGLRLQFKVQTAKVIEGLRVQFKIQKTVSSEPNCAEVSISNLSETSRASLQSKGIRIILEAGYVGNLAQIFSGDTLHVSHARVGADWVSRIQFQDGGRALTLAKVSESFKAGTFVATVFRRLAGALQVDATDAVAFVQANCREQFTQGYSAFGSAKKEIDRLLTGRGFEWSIQDGRLQVTSDGNPTSGSAILLSPANGLIGSPAYGSPEHDEEPFEGSRPRKPKKKATVLKAKSLLQPGIRPGSRVELDSVTAKGLFRVQAVTHTGDTHGGDWYSEVDLIPTSG
jgi:hypothetical protein